MNERLLIILIALGLLGIGGYAGSLILARRLSISWSGVMRRMNLATVEFDYPLKKLLAFPFNDAEAGRRRREAMGSY